MRGHSFATNFVENFPFTQYQLLDKKFYIIRVINLILKPEYDI